MGHTGAGFGKKINLLGIQFDTMRVPDIITGPAQIFGILAGPTAEFFKTIGDILVVLGQMGMQHHALVAGQNRSLSHQITADRKRRTRGYADAHHRALGRVVKRVNDPNAILKDRGFFLDQRIGRQTAVTDPDAHRTPRRVKPQPHLRCRRNGVIQTRPVGIQIQMVRCHRAARQGQFRQTRLRRGEHFFGAKARPDRIERLQPAKKQRVLPTGHSAGQGLIQMVMGIDQTRADHAARHSNIARACNVQLIADRGNHTIFDMDIDPAQPAACIVHRQHDIRSAQNRISHPRPPATPPKRPHGYRHWPPQSPARHDAQHHLASSTQCRPPP